MKFLKYALPIFLVFLSSCSIQKMAINKISDAMSASGDSNVFTQDDDYKFISKSLPFAIKMYETLLSMNPNHKGLNRMVGSLYVMYANAFIQLPAYSIKDYKEQQDEIKRAKKKYLKGYNIILNYLDKSKKYNGFKDALSSGDKDKLQVFLDKIEKEDVEIFYWLSAGLMGAYSIDPMDFDLGSKVSFVTLILEKIYTLDKTYSKGATQDLLAQIYASPIYMNFKRAQKMIKEEFEIANGSSAGVYLTYAKSLLMPQNKFKKAKKQLELAVNFDIEKFPKRKLINVIAKMNAKRELLKLKNMLSFEDSETDDLVDEPDESEDSETEVKTEE